MATKAGDTEYNETAATLEIVVNRKGVFTPEAADGNKLTFDVSSLNGLYGVIVSADTLKPTDPLGSNNSLSPAGSGGSSNTDDHGITPMLILQINQNPG
ncbi:MAG TPA: hypothetical protein DEQ02_03095 [Ruminococcaceae bacterium]|nr:hypothetical protein [Oscillospiraceae bacterium]